jgi:hypothetical protein
VRLGRKNAIAKSRFQPGFTEARDALEAAYAALSALLKARQKASLTQQALALKMGATKSVVSWLESFLRNHSLGHLNHRPRAILVGVRGFEPPASASRTQRSTRLSYTPNGPRLYQGKPTSVDHKVRTAAEIAQAFEDKLPVWRDTQPVPQYWLKDTK